MSKLNAFLAAVPANGLPSPTATKTLGAPPHKAFPSLSIPQIDDEDDVKVAQPATPQPPSHHRVPRSSSNPNSVRAIARRFDSQRTLAIPEDPASDSNQQDAEDATKEPLSPASPSVSTPAKPTQSIKSFRVRSGSLEGSEAGPLKRLNVTQQLQQQHHRRVSTDTAMFSKMLRKQPDHAIDAAVVQFFTTLAVPTVSRPEQDSNQAEEEETRGTIDPAELLASFSRGETVSVATALAIVQQATRTMTMEPNVVALRAPFTLVGDLHGQFSDLVEIFTVHGLPSASNPFLFLGDYVDRGVASCEIVLLLLALKLQCPSSIFLLRGNHECRSLSTFYGFRTECLAKYGLALYNRVIKCFESMPLAATVATAYGKFLAVHGGLSPSITTVDEINDRVDRFREPDPSGALCDLLWADPVKDATSQDAPFAPNKVRGCSYTFNEQVCREFLAHNGLLAIVRAHELEEDGFKEHFTAPRSDADEEDESTSLPPVITVFSAPEYCNTNHNMGATLLIPFEKQRPKLLQYRQHKRSTQREVPFGGASEHDAVRKFLAEQLPFLPVDFYELVVVCRQLRATLELAASIATPAVSSASIVSAAGSEALLAVPAQPVAVASTPPSAIITTRRSVVHTTSIDEAFSVPRRRASTGSGLRLCPGFVRFCEKFLGMKFDEKTSAAEAARVAPDLKKPRRSIDDIHIGTSSSPSTATAATTPVAVAQIQVDVAPAAAAAVNVAETRDKNKLEIFTTAQWTALRLYFSLLDVNGTGVLLEESFVTLLAEQDSDAYATQDELQLLMDVVDCNGDGLITAQDFLQFAFRACLRWKKNAAPRASKTAPGP